MAHYEEGRFIPEEKKKRKKDDEWETVYDENGEPIERRKKDS